MLLTQEHVLNQTECFLNIKKPLFFNDQSILLVPCYNDIMKLNELSKLSELSKDYIADIRVKLGSALKN